MQHLKAFLEATHEHAITNEFDRIVLFIADEGFGKSTLMLESVLLWDDIAGFERTQDGVFEQLVWGDRSKFKRQIVDAEQQSAIGVMDAARVFHKQETQHGEQIELQKDMLDSRFNENLIMLGYQDWDDVPRFLQKRRAKNAIVIPRRGYMRAYNRQSMDRKYETGDWPEEPEFRDTFPAMDGTDIWARFKEIDRERKEERMVSEEDKSATDVRKKTTAEIVLRMVRPWDDEGGMTYREAADYIEYSRQWVGERVRDWQDNTGAVDLTAVGPESGDGMGVAD